MATDRSAANVLGLDWPEPLVPLREIGKHAPWLGEGPGLALAYAPPRLIDIVTLVTSQENACRFCYGSIRATMRISGYSESQINDLEREVELADGMTRDVVRLARNLARSDPRPARAELEALERHDLDPKAIAEIVFVVAITCCNNRLGTFLALPPERKLEEAARSWIGRLVARRIVSRSRTRRVGPTSPVTATGPLAPLFHALPEAPVVGAFVGLVEQVFEPRALDRKAKLMMLAVVARTMGCAFCEDAARKELVVMGMTEDGVRGMLATLDGPDVGPRERLLLDWARETVHYQTGPIQKRTRALASQLDVGSLLEGISVAAVSNTAVRLAMLLA